MGERGHHHRETQAKPQATLGVVAGFVDQLRHFNRLVKAEPGFFVALPDSGDFVNCAPGHVQGELFAAGQRMEQTDANAGFGYVADNAHEFTLR